MLYNNKPSFFLVLALSVSICSPALGCWSPYLQAEVRIGQLHILSYTS